MKYDGLVIAVLLVGPGCGAEVVLDDDPALEHGEGGYLGTGQGDIDAAIKEACDILEERLPNCPQESCIKQGYWLFGDGELSGCNTEAVELMYCSVQNANEWVCLGHHECDSLREAFDDCF